jgi:PleD family two-component response regulator
MNSRRHPNTVPANLRTGYPYLVPAASVFASQSALAVLPFPVVPPLQEEAAPARSKQTPKQPDDRKTVRSRPQILAVDDEEFNLDLLAAVLGDDYDIITANCGQDALDAAARHHPELILLDVMMPRMDGFDVCARLKAEAQTRNIAVMFITGLEDGGFETLGLELGAVDFITKPIMPAAVRARVNNQINLKLALEQVEEMAEMEKALRLDVLEALAMQNRDDKIH